MAAEPQRPKWDASRQQMSAQVDLSLLPELKVLNTAPGAEHVAAPSGGRSGAAQSFQDRMQALMDGATEHILSGRRDEAIRALDDAFKGMGEGGDGMNKMRSVVATRIGDLFREKAEDGGDKSLFGKAAERYNEAMRLDDANHEAFNGFGVAAFQLGDYQSASDAFKQAGARIVAAIGEKSSTPEMESSSKAELERLRSDRRSYDNNLAAAAYKNQEYGTAQFMMSMAIGDVPTNDGVSECKNGVIFFNAGVVIANNRQQMWERANELKDNDVTKASHPETLEIPPVSNTTVPELVAGFAGDIALTPGSLVSRSLETAEAYRQEPDPDFMREHPDNITGYLAFLMLARSVLEDDPNYVAHVQGDQTPNKTGSLSALGSISGFEMDTKLNLANHALGDIMARGLGDVVDAAEATEKQLGVAHPLAREYGNILLGAKQSKARGADARDAQQAPGEASESKAASAPLDVGETLGLDDDPRLKKLDLVFSEK
jgi:tetratricopeptide (TPR) repeat protein